MLRGLLQQLELFLGDSRPPRPPARPPSAPLRSIPVHLVRNPRARRYVLRVGRDGIVRVTIPRGGSAEFARRFAAEKEAWIRTQLERLDRPEPGPPPWGPETPVWFRGDRRPLVVANGWVQLDDLTFPAPGHGDWRPAVEAHLRALAAAELPPQVWEAAARLELPVKRVQIRAQRTRWGSCSRRGTISLNWRLVQTPILVRDYLIAHELAHLRQMNHSRRFWAVVEEFFPAWREAERWLKQHGREILR